MSTPDYNIAPVEAGDLIDRAVRFYRRFFWTFVRISSPPIVLGTLISVGWTLVAREMFSNSTNASELERSLYYMFLGFGSVLIWAVEGIATLMVMGGASRNFVRHMLFGDAITFRETYRNVRERIIGLFAAATIIVSVLGVVGTILLYLTLLAEALMALALASLLGFFPLLAIILGVLLGLGIAFLALWFFFFLASRLAYIPQVMLVEGRNLFAAIGRSASMASRDVKRLSALFIFSIVATYSALALLYVPLLWYASANGVQVMSVGGDMLPAWYEITASAIWQISFIVLTPVWMIGLCLLYIDERVRREAYDIELIAAARLGNIPAVPDLYVNPLQPAMGDYSIAARKSQKLTSLDLG